MLFYENPQGKLLVLLDISEKHVVLLDTRFVPTLWIVNYLQSTKATSFSPLPLRSAKPIWSTTTEVCAMNLSAILISRFHRLFPPILITTFIISIFKL